MKITDMPLTTLDEKSSAIFNTITGKINAKSNAKYTSRIYFLVIVFSPLKSICVKKDY